MSQPIKLTPDDLRALADVLVALNEVEARTGVRFSPNQRLEIEIGESYTSGQHRLRPWVCIGRDADGKHVLDDRIGD